MYVPWIGEIMPPNQTLVMGKFFCETPYALGKSFMQAGPGVKLAIQLEFIHFRRSGNNKKQHKKNRTIDNSSVITIKRTKLSNNYNKLRLQRRSATKLPCSSFCSYLDDQFLPENCLMILVTTVCVKIAIKP